MRTQLSIGVTPLPLAPDSGPWSLNQTCRFLCSSHRFRVCPRGTLAPRIHLHFFFLPIIIYSDFKE